ncbi:DUF2931 family protein [Pseudomonas alkylphenolica]|uniref:DUF2931 family protein n=1 Tax=Pseudomonas alkylphenolica TaxID=237609 RepID=UPI0018D8922E|nr:DUF2931 family protein [Pseudomonas alkylphenolica]MBH3427952.1 DUF2931 family protein [Pseudomonas alkylphenolica]
MKSVLMGLLALLLISGCQALDPLSGEHDAHAQWWSIDFHGPDYMKGWVENSTVEDVDGRIIDNRGGGVIGSDTPEDGTESARGWRWVSSNVMPVVGASLPKRVFVRWQSIVEPQTYKAWVDIPEEGREVMRTSTSRRCPETRLSRYGASMILGLAPGGTVQVWARDRCGKAVKIARAQAEIEPLGPSQGKNEGRYAYKISEKSRRYIERFGIPYGSW